MVTRIAVSGFRSVLSNPSFRALWLAQIFAQVADKIFFIILVTMVARITPSNSAMSLALVAYTVPTVFFGAVAGALVDRWDKRWAMVLTNLLRGVAILLTTWTGEIYWVLVVVAFLVSTFSQPFTPAESSVIPLVVERDELLCANSLFATTIVASIIVGFTLGEPLIAFTTLTWAPAITAGMYLASSLALLGLHYQPKPVEERKVRMFVDELRSGWRYIRRHDAVWGAILRLVILYAMFSAMSVVSILFAKGFLQASFSLFLALAGGGLAVGAWAIGHLGVRWDRSFMITLGFLGDGVTLLLMLLLRPAMPLPAYFLSFLVGLSSAFVAIPNQTALQESVPEHQRGKVFGTQNMAINLATTIPMAGIGPLADLIGIKPVFGILGVGMLLVGIFPAVRLSLRK